MEYNELPNIMINAFQGRKCEIKKIEIQNICGTTLIKLALENKDLCAVLTLYNAIDLHINFDLTIPAFHWFELEDNRCNSNISNKTYHIHDVESDSFSVYFEKFTLSRK